MTEDAGGGQELFNVRSRPSVVSLVELLDLSHARQRKRKRQARASRHLETSLNVSLEERGDSKEQEGKSRTPLPDQQLQNYFA